MYPETYNPPKYRSYLRWKKRFAEQGFRCIHCQAHVYTQAMVSGVQNRNHCPYCLHSRHVDHARAGDRLSACKATMLPIGLTMKPNRNKYGLSIGGELMLVHRCSGCGKLSLNRLAADDQVERLLELYYASIELDELIIEQLSDAGILMLTANDRKTVERQLQGIRPE